MRSGVYEFKHKLSPIPDSSSSELDFVVMTHFPNQTDQTTNFSMEPLVDESMIYSKRGTLLMFLPKLCSLNWAYFGITAFPNGIMYIAITLRKSGQLTNYYKLRN